MAAEYSIAAWVLGGPNPTDDRFGLSLSLEGYNIMQL
jgi:hypothetical protein